MQTLLLRMKGRYHSGDHITALSVSLTPKTALSGKWIEIAYWTFSGAVHVILQHPESVGQLFQMFTVHTSPITKMMLSAKHLVSDTVGQLWTSPRRSELVVYPSAEMFPEAYAI